MIQSAGALSLQISLQTFEFGSLSGAVGEDAAELGLCHCLDVGGCEVEYLLAGCKEGLEGGLCLGIMRAAELTFVAPIQAFAFGLRHPFGQFSSALYQLARQASAGIGGAAIGAQRSSGTRFHATAALSTSHSARLVGLKCQGGDHFAKKEK